MSIKVKPRTNETLNSTLKRLRKLCEKEGLTRDMRRQEAYEKPSEKRRRQVLKSRIRMQRTSQEPRPF